MPSLPVFLRRLVRATGITAYLANGGVLEHAQEMEPDVVAQHIGLYVNKFTEDLGEEGYAAVRTLLGRAADAGLTPPSGL